MSHAGWGCRLLALFHFCISLCSPLHSSACQAAKIFVYNNSHVVIFTYIAADRLVRPREGGGEILGNYPVGYSERPTARN
jgi:hypothetical protein